MGYESRLYIVRKFDTCSYDDGKCYAQVIAMFDMCKFYELSDVLRHKPVTDCYIYADDHNTRVLEDRYDEPLTEATVESVIELLENIVAKGEEYWRIFPLLSALKSIKEQTNNWDKIVVLHYGY